MESCQNEDVMVIDGENEIGFNEWNMEDESLNSSFQIQQNTTKEIIESNEKNEMEFFFQTLHVQRKIWRGHNKNAICWVLYCVNDDKEINPRNPRIVKCLFCYGSLMHALNPNTKERKGLITYYRTYGITTFKKHVYCDNVVIIKKIEVDFLVKETFERKPTKNGLMFQEVQNLIFFLIKDPFKKDDE
jgi:hypothetical protein